MSDRRFTFFESYKDVAALMSDEERLAFYDALVGYGVCGEEPDDLEGAPLVAFTMARPSLDKSARRARANAKNARQRARREPDSQTEPDDSEQEPEESEQEPTESETERTQANASETERTETYETDSLVFAFPDIDIDIDKDKDGDRDKDQDRDKAVGGGPPAPKSKSSRPHHPSWDEWWERWRSVSGERGLPPSEYDARKAFAYYDANGWRQKNGNPVRRWKGALSTCFLNAHPELRSSGRGESADADAFTRYD